MGVVGPGRKVFATHPFDAEVGYAAIDGDRLYTRWTLKNKSGVRHRKGAFILR